MAAAAPGPGVRRHRPRAPRRASPCRPAHREVSRLDDAGATVKPQPAAPARPRTTPRRQRPPRWRGHLRAASRDRRAVHDHRCRPGRHLRLLGGPRRRAAQPSAHRPELDVLVVGTVDRADLCETADRVHERLGIEVNPSSAPHVRDGSAHALLTQIKNLPSPRRRRHQPRRGTCLMARWPRRACRRRGLLAAGELPRLTGGHPAGPGPRSWPGPGPVGVHHGCGRCRRSPRQ